MSKNYELIQQADIRLDVPALSQPTTNPLSSPADKKNENAKTMRLYLDDNVTREESFKLVQNVFLRRGEGSPRVVVFAGIDSGNGCSAICTYTAETLASQKLGTVCLVDANLRSPSLPEHFGISNHYGLTDALSTQGAIRDFATLVVPDNLWLLSCGSLASESPRFLNSANLKSRIAELRAEFDYVLIDTPPLNSYADGIAIGQLADGLVLVLEANATRREAAGKVTENLRAAQIKILGAVLNKRTYPIPRALYNRL
jgi:protein-tyrosine kinase